MADLLRATVEGRLQRGKPMGARGGARFAARFEISRTDKGVRTRSAAKYSPAKERTPSFFGMTGGARKPALSGRVPYCDAEASSIMTANDVTRLWHKTWSLRDHRAHRCRWNGRNLSRARYAARSRSCAQGAARIFFARRRSPAALRARGTFGRGAQPSEHPRHS